MSTLPLILVAVLAAGITLWPLLKQAGGRLRVSRSDTALGRLEFRKATLIENIADLDFEHAMGKLADEDHRTLRATLEQQAMAVLEQIEVLRGATDSEQDEEIAHRFCHMCGEGVPRQARFCPACGQSLQAMEVNA